MTTRLAALALALAALSGCSVSESSDGDDPAVEAEATADTETLAVASPEEVADIWRSAGASPDLADCYAAVLTDNTDVAIRDLRSLSEAQASLSAEARKAFDDCVTNTLDG